ncbi:hypothetical protein Tco_0739151, partial [Tanacetum coccineum]
MKWAFKEEVVISFRRDVLSNYLLATPTRVRGNTRKRVESFVLNRLATLSTFLICSIAFSVELPEKVVLRNSLKNFPLILNVAFSGLLILLRVLLRVRYCSSVRRSISSGPKLSFRIGERSSYLGVTTSSSHKLKAARDHQKSYADKRRKPLEFSVSDHVLLKVSPWKGVVCFGKKGKLAPRFVGPFEIIERIGLGALPQELNGVHDTFHVSNLKKCLTDQILHVPLEEIQVDAKLNFVEEPVEIQEREFKKLKRSRIPIVKVRWNSKRGPEFTWEREDQMKLKYPHLFSS